MEKTNICSLCFDFKRNKNVDKIEKKSNYKPDLKW